MAMRERTCISCRAVSAKERMYRIARTSAGEVAFDPTGKGAGRGAYVCSIRCFEDARRKGRFSSALRCKVSAEAYAEVENGLLRAISADADGCEGC